MESISLTKREEAKEHILDLILQWPNNTADGVTIDAMANAYARLCDTEYFEKAANRIPTAASGD